MAADEATHSSATETNAPRVPLPMKPLKVLQLMMHALMTTLLLMPESSPWRKNQAFCLSIFVDSN